MSFNIVDLVKDQISDQLMGTMGNALGIDSTQTSSALSGALPGLLGGLAQSTSTPAGADALFNSVQKQDDGLLGNMGNLLGGGGLNDVADQGSSALTSLLGGGALGKLSEVVSSFAGINRGSSSSLMGILAPIVLGVIKKKVMGDGMNASSVASMFTGQKDNINAAMPQGFSDQLGSSGFFDSIGATRPAVSINPSATVDSVNPSATVGSVNPSATVDSVVEAQPKKAGLGLFRWLLPVAGLAIAVLLGMQFLGGDKAEDAVNATQDAASNVSDEAAAASSDALQAAQDAMPEGVDLGAITGNIDGVFSSTTDTLSGITDVESATAALPALEEASGKLGGISDVVSRLPDAAKGPVGSVVQSGLAALQPIIEKVSAIPGVGGVIGPVIEPLMSMLEGLAG